MYTLIYFFKKFFFIFWKSLKKDFAHCNKVEVD